MLTAQPAKISINGIDYIAEASGNNEIVLRRYLPEYKIWLVVSFPNTTDKELEKSIKSKLKNMLLDQITKDIAAD